MSHEARVKAGTFPLTRDSGDYHSDTMPFNSVFVCKFDCFLLLRIPDGLTAEDRILAVLEFYLTSFHAGRKVSLSNIISCTVALLLYSVQ